MFSLQEVIIRIKAFYRANTHERGIQISEAGDPQLFEYERVDLPIVELQNRYQVEECHDFIRDLGIR